MPGRAGRKPVSQAQRRLMYAAAAGDVAGVSKSVGKEFVAGDRKAGKRKLPARLGRGLINRTPA